MMLSLVKLSGVTVQQMSSHEVGGGGNGYTNLAAVDGAGGGLISPEAWYVGITWLPRIPGFSTMSSESGWQKTE